MNFVFEDIEKLENFTNCPDINLSSIRRFAPSPLASVLIHNIQGNQKIQQHNSFMASDYIIATGVNHHPNDWTGSNLAYRNNRQSSFSFLNAQHLTDLREERAMLLFDQSLEGYQTSWLWEYFHSECRDYGINPRAVIYITGNLLCIQQYTAWANSNDISDRINVFPYAHFEEDIRCIAKDMNLVSNFDDNLRYKKENLKNIKTYNCLQKRLRAHRIWFYTYLFNNKILSEGLVTMNKFDITQSYFEGAALPNDQSDEYNEILPLEIYGKNNTEHDDNYYIRRIIDKVFLDTWVSVVSEASFGDNDQTIFLSEKIFKPIVCLHPFIIVGNRNSLQKIRDMGYKTFDGFIDESYDTLPTFERFEAIIESLKKIIAIENKTAWFESMKEILVHNYNTMQENSKHKNPAIIKLENCYNNYFDIGKKHV